MNSVLDWSFSRACEPGWRAAPAEWGELLRNIEQASEGWIHQKLSPITAASFHERAEYEMEDKKWLLSDQALDLGMVSFACGLIVWIAGSPQFQEHPKWREAVVQHLRANLPLKDLMDPIGHLEVLAPLRIGGDVVRDHE